MKERRQENRLWCADLVKVEWSTGQGQPGTAEGVLEDISALGACVQMEDPIPDGAAILMTPNCAEGACRSECPDERKAVRFSGIVLYCEFRGFGYFVGIRFSDETRWSSGVFEPDHLTDVAALGQS